MIAPNAANGIEITPEMIRIGVLELREKTFGEDLGEIVYDIYLAMEFARRDKPTDSVERGGDMG